VPYTTDAAYEELYAFPYCATVVILLLPLAFAISVQLVRSITSATLCIISALAYCYAVVAC